ncbi:MAG TPA: PASTA domain-containing protein [Candidatus Acidoferrales bacterium]|nr:PASTA domain-containing protein [Candidatus Acidoferrales bacterium]
MSFRDRIEWAGRMTLLVFFLASIAFLSALMTMRLVIQGREVATPNLIGLPVTQAERQASSQGLHVRIEDKIYSSLPKDAVVRQSPASGNQLKKNESIYVVLSLGVQNTTIPQLDDRSLHAAQIELLSGGLQAGEISSVHLAGFGADVILKQQPPAGSTNATSPHVDMLLSMGAPDVAYVMPSLDGLTQAEAQQRLDAAGLKVSKVTALPLTGKPSGTVTSQLPLRGARVEPGVSVELQVAQ